MQFFLKDYPLFMLIEPPTLLLMLPELKKVKKLLLP
jgi:hypothetical protein